MYQGARYTSPVPSPTSVYNGQPARCWTAAVTRKVLGKGVLQETNVDGTHAREGRIGIGALDDTGVIQSPRHAAAVLWRWLKTFGP